MPASALTLAVYYLALTFSDEVNSSRTGCRIATETVCDRSRITGYRHATPLTLRTLEAYPCTEQKIVTASTAFLPGDSYRYHRV